VQNRRLRVISSFLTLSNAALFGGAAQATGSWQPLEIIDMTTTSNVSADVVVTTGFFDDLDFVSLEEPVLSIASDGIPFDTETPKKSGWAGLVEVEVTEEPTLPYGESSAFADTFTPFDEETKVQGFYTMRYQFDTDRLGSDDD